MYADNNGDWLPLCWNNDLTYSDKGRWWGNLLQSGGYLPRHTSHKYLPSVCDCPSRSGLISWNYGDYGMNMNIAGDFSEGAFLLYMTQHKTSAIRYPSQCILVGDGNELLYSIPKLGYAQAGHLFGDRHSGGSNIVWVDGHVSWTRDAVNQLEESQLDAPHWAADGKNVNN